LPIAPTATSTGGSSTSTWKPGYFEGRDQVVQAEAHVAGPSGEPVRELAQGEQRAHERRGWRGRRRDAFPRAHGDRGHVDVVDLQQPRGGDQAIERAHDVPPFARVADDQHAAGACVVRCDATLPSTSLVSPVRPCDRRRRGPRARAARRRPAQCAGRRPRRCPSPRSRRQ
jgi:hypothetical protein